ncbi:MAG: type I glutamate--ammonia ligase [bacterium]|nr:type I glutamate--ammonia ligase [bacterium]
MIMVNAIKLIDLKFTDLFGMWQHFTIPAHIIKEGGPLEKSIWVEGIGFDGSSIRGFQQIQESDMILIPDPSTAVLDPVAGVPTLSLICDVYDPVTHQAYSRDPRYIAKKAEAYLREAQIADVSYWGPEMEFFIFNHVAYHQATNEGYYHIDSDEGSWNTGKNDGEPNLGYKVRPKEGYFPVPPHDSLQDIRSEMVLKLMDVGIEVETHHHEVATAGQCEIDLKYRSLTAMGDIAQMYKYIVKNIAKKHGMVATFMPKPLFGDNGSGMHIHQSLWKDGDNLFYDAGGYALISQTAEYYIGGILKHAEALMAFCAPTTNSYKRLVPGYEAPVNLTYSQRNRSAAVRIPMYSASPKARRIEFRSPDGMANPYLAFSAMLMAGLDGIANRIEPEEPFEENTYELSPGMGRTLKTVPKSLEQSLEALEKDHEFLLAGDVFTKDVIDTWLEHKAKEADAMRLRPHPHEFTLYFDA